MNLMRVLAVLLSIQCCLLPWGNAQNADAIKNTSVVSGTAPGNMSLLLDSALLLKCFTFSVVGTCPLGVIVLYWNPDFYVECVKEPFTTGIPLIKTVLNTESRVVRSIAGIERLLSGSDEYEDTGDIRVQGFDVHVIRIPIDIKDIVSLFGLCSRLPDDYEVNYLSELDLVNWRTGLVDYYTQFSKIVLNYGCVLTGILFPNCLGFWGPMAPRVFSIHHYSDSVGALVAAWRACHISWILGSLGHVVLKPHEVPITLATKWSMIWPKQTGCIRTGQHPATWDWGKVSFSGQYGWLCWNPIVCCVV